MEKELKNKSLLNIFLFSSSLGEGVWGFGVGGLLCQPLLFMQAERIDSSSVYLSIFMLSFDSISLYLPIFPFFGFK